MNFLVSHVTRKAPIKVTQRKGYKDRESGRSVEGNLISQRGKIHFALFSTIHCHAFTYFYCFFVYYLELV